MRRYTLHKAMRLAFFTITALGVISARIACGQNAQDKGMDALDEAASNAREAIDEAIDRLGDDFSAIQDYLSQYTWKGIIQGSASSGPVTLSHLILNGHKRVALVKPGEIIDAEVTCEFDRKKISSFSVYRVLIGIKGSGPQISICNSLGMFAHKSVETFKLQAPIESGMYQIRFLTVEKYLESSALREWTNEKGEEPDAEATIGIIFVKS
jgi:hypothetical protein